MAVLGKIRQRSIFLILVIGMALFAFVISGVFGNNNASSGPDDPLATINDEEIDVLLFRQMVEQTERNTNYSTLQSVDLVWNQMLRSTILEQEFEKLGIDAGKEQLEQIISSNDSFVNDPRFQNETGFFDFGIFMDFIAQLKLENPQAYDSWKLQESNLVGVAKQNIYFDLIKASTLPTEVEAKASYHLENDNVNIKYVQVPYSFINDSLVTVSDREIKKYINDHKDLYEREASRNIQFVLFEELATEEDEEDIRLQLEALKDERIAYNDVSKLTDTLEGLKTTKNITEFVATYSDVAFDSIYRPKGGLANEYAEILFGLSKGEVFGPYKDGSKYKISRFIDRKDNANIRASHILIAYEGASRAPGTVTISKEEAKRKANQLLREARRNPDDFARLARENSDGPTKNRGGDLGFFQEGLMAPEFFEFCNKNKVNQLGVVETEFGFHLIKITDKEDLALIADVSAAIIPSEKTSNEIFRKATQFEIDSANEGDFIASAEKIDAKVRPANNITIMEESLPGLVRQRNIVQWAYESGTDVGDIKRFNLSSGGYVVVQLTQKKPKGLASINEARFPITQILLKEKKTALIKEQLAGLSTLEALAEKEDFTIETASAINQKNPIIVGAGNEPHVVGVAFGMDVDQTSGLIQGNNGVYKIQLTQKTVVPDLETYTNYAKLLRQQQNTKLAEAVYNALKKTSSIEDNRALYY